MIELPSAIEAYFEADRSGCPDAIAATFTENGVVKDKGKIHIGQKAIRAWMTDEAQQYSYAVRPFLIAVENGKTQVMAHAAGTFPGSPIDLRFIFVLSGDRIAELEITL